MEVASAVALKSVGWQPSLDIVVTLHIDHPQPADLKITLEDPTGDCSDPSFPYQNTCESNGHTWAAGNLGLVSNQQVFTNQPISVSVGAGDDMVNGAWTLHIEDVVTGNAGILNGWSVYLISNWD